MVKLIPTYFGYVFEFKVVVDSHIEIGGDSIEISSSDNDNYDELEGIVPLKLTDDSATERMFEAVRKYFNIGSSRRNVLL